MKDWYNHLHHGDAITALNKLDPQSANVDLVFADPPYNIGYSYDVYQDELEDEAYLHWTEQWIRAANRVLKPTGAFWIAIGDEYVAEIKCLCDKIGLHLRNWVVWYYTFGVHCRQKFTRSHTHLLYYIKDPNHFTFNDGAIRVPSARQLVYADARAHAAGRVPDNTWILRPQDAVGGFGPDHDTWYFARVAGTFKERAGFHGCQLPERLLERIIRSCTQPDEVVFDPFAGSGSTLIVAKKLGRQWVGYELSADYVRNATARLQAVRAGDPIDGPEDPLSSAPATPLGRWARRETPDEAGIVEAFRRAADGYSADRVIADPVLNAAFVDQCGQRGIAGRPRDWNLTLLGMRKNSKLADVPTIKRTTFSWEQMDAYEFAAEIAVRRMLDMGFPSVDYVLCDPTAAFRFDDLARSLAPGFGALQYRWAALRLRKDARLWRTPSEWALQTAERDRLRIDLTPLELATLRNIPAVYLLSPMTVKPVRRKRGEARSQAPDDAATVTPPSPDAPPAYVGETSDLRARGQRILDRLSALDQFLANSGQWQFEAYELPDVGQTERRKLQSLLIARTHPRLNFPDLTAHLEAETGVTEQGLIVVPEGARDQPLGDSD